MIKKTIERTQDTDHLKATITTTYRVFGKPLYVKVVDYSLAKDFPSKA